MTISNIIEILKSNLLFALVLSVAIGVFFFLIYVLLIKLKFIKKINKKRIVLIFLFTIYILTVLAATLISRQQLDLQTYEFTLFSSYKKAWNEFDLRGFQFIYLNIAMFLPLGIFLPLLNKKLQEWFPALLVAFLFTTFIEVLQFVLRRGVFEVDDLFNNTLGALIGFGLVMVSIKRKINIKSLLYLAPLLLVIVTSLTFYMYYSAKEFGNLSVAPNTTIKVEHISVDPKLILGNETTFATVYKAPSITESEAEQFAYNLFALFELDTNNIEKISYQDEVHYRYRGNPSRFITIKFLDHSFSYIDFSSHKDDVKLSTAEASQLTKNLTDNFNITVPDFAEFSEYEPGRYKWTVDHRVDNHQLTNGNLRISFYDDGTIKDIDQRIVVYDEVKSVAIISEQDAYEIVKKGKFNYYKNQIKSLEVTNITLSHSLDSKGFYQPVYRFETIIDDNEYSISIPALK